MPTIIVNGQEADVLRTIDYDPGTHTHSPILNVLPAREFITRYGSRWTGIKPDGSMYCNPLGDRVTLKDLEKSNADAS